MFLSLLAMDEKVFCTILTLLFFHSGLIILHVVICTVRPIRMLELLH